MCTKSRLLSHERNPTFSSVELRQSDWNRKSIHLALFKLSDTIESLVSRKVWVESHSQKASITAKKSYVIGISTLWRGARVYDAKLAFLIEVSLDCNYSTCVWDWSRQSHQLFFIFLSTFDDGSLVNFVLLSSMCSVGISDSDLDSPYYRQ